MEQNKAKDNKPAKKQKDKSGRGIGRKGRRADYIATDKRRRNKIRKIQALERHLKKAAARRLKNHEGLTARQRRRRHIVGPSHHAVGNV
jgi:hypothetical protein